jgi:hypothetical protein
MQRVPNPFRPKQVTEPAIVIEKWIFVADNQGDVHAAQVGKPLRTV